jgi:glycosyltransferase involved in cell wall biosynthesis
MALADRDCKESRAEAPLVSVITPFLNANPFLEEAIRSVLAQTLSAFELLLIDDGSTDGSSAVARDYAARFPEQIRYFEHTGHTNRGKSISRNLGIGAARGAYLTFLDADDVFLPRKLESQMQLLEQNPQAVMVYGATEYWHSWDPQQQARSGKGDRRGRLGVAPGRLYSPPQLAVAYLRDPGVVPCICGLLARTAIVKSTGTFDESIQDLFEDQIFLIKMLMSGAVYVESGCGERYRQHPDSSSARAIASGRYHPVRANPARLVYLEWLRGYLQQHGRISADLRRALNAAFRPYRHPTLYRALYPLKAFFGWLISTLPKKLSDSGDTPH